MTSKWDGNEAGFKKWLRERIQQIDEKYPAGMARQEVVPNAPKLDPNLARINQWKREQQWWHSWRAINARRPGWIDTTIPAKWIDLVETQPLRRVNISVLDTCRVQTVHPPRDTEQMSPVTTGHTEAIPKTTKVLPRDQAEYRMSNKSLLDNMQLAIEQFWLLDDTRRMPSRMFLSRFNLQVARMMNHVQEAEVCGQPALFFVYADVFLIRVEEYILLSDQTILCWQ